MDGKLVLTKEELDALLDRETGLTELSDEVTSENTAADQLSGQDAPHETAREAMSEYLPSEVHSFETVPTTTGRYEVSSAVTASGYMRKRADRFRKRSDESSWEQELMQAVQALTARVEQLEGQVKEMRLQLLDHQGGQENKGKPNMSSNVPSEDKSARQLAAAAAEETAAASTALSRVKTYGRRSNNRS
ncbi:hypothetical protein EBB07_20475 [Paenibacillaceae bacterium]|nr:hypothetical protein EBB07_20475 [Paenibacillaceae bacterium]